MYVHISGEKQNETHNHALATVDIAIILAMIMQIAMHTCKF